MNERIRELAKQAGMPLKSCRPYYNDEPDGYLESDNDFILNNHDAVMVMLEGGLQKFAELIVRECVAIVRMNDDETFSEADGRARTILREIKEHFGVE